MNKKIIFFAITLVFVLISGCGETIEAPSASSPQAQTQENSDEPPVTPDESSLGYIDIPANEAKKLIDENPELIIIDVSPNYDKGHIPGAVNYYVGDSSLDNAIPSLDKNSVYLVYCHVDSASILGAQKLVDAGFMNVYRLDGNYRAWVDAGYPVER